MHRALRFCPAFLLLGLVSAPVPGQESRIGALALAHVTVIDMTGAPAKPDMTVVVSGSRIVAVGKTGRVRLPEGAQVIDAAGKFLIPGLWDMHVHLTETERTLPMLVANGVTGVRDMGGNQESLFRWRAEIAAGALPGPRIVACGPILDGPEPASDPAYTVIVGDAAAGRLAVDTLAQQGADCVKVYDRLPREAYFAIVEEARKKELPAVGHVPLSVTTLEASEAGQRSIEHLGTILEGSSSIEPELRKLAEAPLPSGDFSEFPRRIAARGERMLDTYDEQKARHLFARLARNRTWQVPTLVVKRALAYVDDIVRDGDARLKYIPKQEQEWWSPQKSFLLRYRTPEYIVYSKRLFRKSLELVGAMQRAGVPFMTGTDLVSGYIYPGFSLHDELALFVEAGFTPMEALQAATRNPARFLGEQDSRGTVERGKLADLVLLDANPLEDIRNTQRIDAVVLNGRYLPREALQKLLAGAEAAAARE